MTIEAPKSGKQKNTKKKIHTLSSPVTRKAKALFFNQESSKLLFLFDIQSLILLLLQSKQVNNNGSSSSAPPHHHTSLCALLVFHFRRTIWPGLLSGAGTAQLPTTGFALKSGKSRTVTIPKSWSGRIWGRTLCTQRAGNQTFSCVTADCGSGRLECAGGGAAPPATLAEFTLNGAGGLDFYDVSLVDGYNLPMLVLPKGGKGGGCAATGCLVDLNGACPAELRVATRGRTGGGVACRSACEAFGDPRYCCSEAYATPDTCAPSVYSLFFKHACPRAYSYAYDDKTSTYTCASADYIIVFCPPPYTSILCLLYYKQPKTAGSTKRWCIATAREQEYNLHCKSTCKPRIILRQIVDHKFQLEQEYL
ncbi:hypothetical protein JRO89_XS02G0019900 [Xanthoceras sorbifolium]|uniref:Thaumatin-like protein 1b n=1 Tax=Xanthoceras sorbifolium TaxID=99658 RepID=A0ABQ8IDY7_9ROSI|nr:hypothetical protein JRO89_XS02G0019900 [Xanthoceras sorbifolium]